MGVRNIAKGRECLQKLQDRHPQGVLTLVELDVTSDDSISAAAKTLTADYGRLDVLINNAAICHKDNRLPRSEIHATFDANVFGPMLLTRALTPLLKASKAPKVINVTSELGSIGLRSDPTAKSYHTEYDAYRMSKAALNMLTAVHNHELGKFGCKVWSYCPGFVITHLTGEDDHLWKKPAGAESSETSAQGIVEILEGKRDGEVGTFIARYGEGYPW